VPVAGVDSTATVQVAVPAALVAHEFVDHSGRDAGVLEPGREGVPAVMWTAELEMAEVGALDGSLVHAAHAVAGQKGSDAGDYKVAASRTSEYQDIWIGARGVG
jgi:hypothetical protein